MKNYAWLLCVVFWVIGCSSGAVDELEEPVDSQAQKAITLPAPTALDDFQSGAERSLNGAAPVMCLGTVNQGGANETGNTARQGLLKFDLTGIPSGSTIVSATLTLTPVSCSFCVPTSPATRTVSIQRAGGSWDPSAGPALAGGSGGYCLGGAGVAPNRGTAGGSTATSRTYGAALGAMSFSGANVIADVQAMLTTNNGWIISIDTLMGMIASSEAASGQPTLAVTYTLGNGQVCTGGDTTNSTQCTSTECYDGRCCNSQCDGPCRSCSTGGSCTNSTNPSPAGGCGLYLCNAGACRGSCSSDTHCVAGNYCSGGSCVPKLGLGATCAGDNQCSNGQCVDNRCCGSASCPTCQACRADWTVGADGACANIDPLTDPNNECSPGSCSGGACTTSCTADNQCNPGFHCTSSTAGTCVADQANGALCSGDTIDATGAHQCSSNFCVDGRCCVSDCTTACRSCANSNGTCTTVITSQDDPGSCSGVTTCNAGGVCLPTSGSTCMNDGQCASGQCEDGFCCNVDCGDSNATDCIACNVGGSQGTCSPVPAGSVTCRASAGVCDPAEQCNGTATCPANAFDTTTQCRAASCAAGTETLAATCAGTANCPAVQTNACNPYICGATACQTNCTSDANCTSTNWCNGTQCVAKSPNGGACTEGRQCSSNQCVDGVCCNAACTGQCQACDVAGSVGTCTPVSGAPHGTRTACVGDGSACNGQCDGVNVNACALPGAATQCRAPQCNNGQAILEGLCAGNGSCPAQQTQVCDPYRCSATLCLTSCTTDTQCQSGFRCDAGACVPARMNGEVCATNTECGSGFCVDGFCCNAACNGQCEACSVAGFEGACTEVTGAPVGTRPSCADDGSVCGGSCNGVQRAACTYPGAAVECRAASCASGQATLSAACSGTGSCPTSQSLVCPTGMCAGDLCDGNCTVDGNCSAGAEFCAAGVCTPTKPNGQVCSRDSMCVSGRCVDGYCCNGACDGQCEACNATGSEGTCTPVSGAPRGARQACSTDGTSCAGTCDGVVAAACTYPGATTVCRSAACSAGVATLEGYCSGGGTCSPLQQQTCSPFICHPTDPLCDGDCTTDTDCSGGQFCAGGVCVDPQPAGSACGTAAQCASGNCVDGVCCDTSCTGQCQACDQPGQVGTCSIITGTPRGGRPTCGGTGACAGSCDGTSPNCDFPNGSTVCGPGSCTAGVATPAAACNGSGSCLNSIQTSCAPYQCSGVVCATQCTQPSDCVAGFDCVAGACEAIGVGGAGGMAGAGGAAGMAGAGGMAGASVGGAGGTTGGVGGSVGIPDAGPAAGGTAGTSGLILGVDEGSTCAVSQPGSRRELPSRLPVALGGLLFVGGLLRRRRSALRSL